MRHWCNSTVNPGFHLLVDFNEIKGLDGMPRLEPTLLGFIHVRAGRIFSAGVYHPDPVELALAPNTRLFEAKQALESYIT